MYTAFNLESSKKCKYSKKIFFGYQVKKRTVFFSCTARTSTPKYGHNYGRNGGYEKSTTSNGSLSTGQSCLPRGGGCGRALSSLTLSGLLLLQACDSGLYPHCWSVYLCYTIHKIYDIIQIL